MEEGYVTQLLTTTTLGERVADALRQRILGGGLAPGSELKQDRLAEQFGVSRIPVREALQMLERDGLVTAKLNRRVAVATLTDSDVLDRYSVRALVEGEAAARAAVGRADLTALSSAEKATDEARSGRDFAAFVSASAVFHRCIWDASGSTQLRVVAGQLWSGRDYTPKLLPEQLERSHEEHRNIAEAIRDNAAEDARRVMTEHVMSTARDLKAYRDEVGLGRDARKGRPR